MNPERPRLGVARSPPSSGFYAAARVAARLEAVDSSSTLEGPARRYVEGLLRTSDVFMCDDAPPAVLPALLAALEPTIAMHALVLVEDGRGAGPTTRIAGTIDGLDRPRVEAHARAAFAYLADLAEGFGSEGTPGVEIALPLVEPNGAVFALLLALVGAPASEADLAFLDAVAAQLAIRLVRERREVLLADARERERASHQATSTALRRASFLADALAILDAAPDPSREMNRLARLVACRLGDGCVIELGTGEARARTASTRLLAPLLDGAIARLVPRAIVMGRTLVASGEAPRAGPFGDDDVQIDAEAEVARSEVGAAWLVCAPIRARDESLGAIVVFGGPGAAPCDARATHVLARLVAASIERARPYRAALASVDSCRRVLAMVAHDVKQPLNAMLLNVTALIGRMPANGDRRRFGRDELARIRRSVERLRRLTDDLLDVSSLEARAIRIECTDVQVADLLAEAVGLLAAPAAQRGISLRVSPPRMLPAAWADAGRVQQVLQNLIGNAIKFSPADGTITIDAHATDGAIAVSIHNEGEGITEHDRAAIFDRFWQAKGTASLGTGIGLTITKAIVEAHGGSVTVESAAGSGATFTFTLPLAS